MSKRSNRNRNLVTLDRRELQRLVDAEIARKFTNPQGGTVTPIPQNIIAQMQAQLAPQAKSQGMFSPGAPLTPIPGITPAQGPRQWQYPVGYNIGQLPRSTEMTSFDTLRNLAALYDGVGICERKWFDLCSKPELQIKPRDELTKDKNGKPIPQTELDGKYGARIEKWKAFFKKPDKKRSLKRWMRRGLKDVLELDALAIFKHKDRSGGLFALEIIDGSTIKPLLDERGMEPDPPFPAYQQWVYGIPGMELLYDQLIYRKETERTNSPYGLSRVELIILRINQALRKQNKDLATFTDGNIPAGTLEPPDDGSEWTPEQLLAYQIMWDGMLAGNEEIKARIKVIPPGAKFNKTDPDDIMVAFDEFLLRVTCGAFGIPMTEISFTEQSNRSTGESQEAMLYRGTMSLTMDMFGEIFTDVMAEEDGNDDLVATWKEFEEPEDFKTKVEAEDILVKNGTMSTSEGARYLGIEPMFETEPFIVVPGSGITFISDANDPQMREQAKAAKLAGYQQAQQPPEEQSDEQEPQQTSQGKTGAMGGKQASSGGTTKGAGGSKGEPAKDDSSAATKTETRSVDAVVPGESADSQREISAELRRWRECAIKDVKEGRIFRAFFAFHIKGDVYKRIDNALRTECKTVDDVWRVFDAERAKKPAPQDAEVGGSDPPLEYNAKLDIWEPADTEQQLEALRAKGWEEFTWHSHASESGICPTCEPNDGVTRRIGEQFPSGHRIPQCHNGCQCSVVKGSAK